ncbi:MAG: hypothetical protein GY714_11170 [Desulfobacterales bacterium]|nr:hypothetical protein [Desulfobacterales bacterium]
MDAGIATEENIEWLKKNQYRYLVVSRKRHREFSADKAVEVKEEKDYTVKVYKTRNEETGEVELYFNIRKPRPLGVVRVQRLSQLNINSS